MDYTEAKLYDHYTAQALMLLNIHNPALEFQGFAYPSTATPSSHAENHAWIVAESGEVFGISANKGQVIRDTGSEYVSEDIQLFKKDNNIFIDPKIYLTEPKITDYTDDNTTLVTSGVAGDNNIGSPMEFYSGKYRRLYFIYKTEDANDTYADGSGYEARINYYDYDDEAFGDSVVVPVKFESTDSHCKVALTITQTGYIIVVATDDDYNYRIIKSDDPEDISSWTKITDAETLGYNTYNNYPDICKCKNLLIGAHRLDLYARQILVSDDEGETWDYYRLFQFDERSNTGYWPYGKLYPAGNKGVFQELRFNNNNDGEGGDKANNFPKSAILWSDDGITWGNMLYYVSGKRRGFSKNLDSEGHITEDEMLNNCLFIDNPWGSEEDGWPSGSTKDILVRSDGSVIIISYDGERDDSQDLQELYDIRISHWNYDNDDWEHTKIPLDDLSHEAPRLYMLPSGVNPGDIDLIQTENSGTHIQFSRWRLNDYGKNYRKIEDLTSFDDDTAMVVAVHFMEEQQGMVFLALDESANYKFIRFDKRWR